MINSWTGFQPLKEVWLGAPWPLGWETMIFKTAKDQENLKKITEISIQQLNEFQRIMENDGILVRRPRSFTPQEVYDDWLTYEDAFREMFSSKLKRGDTYEEFIQNMRKCFGNAERCAPELNPRDNFIVYGKTLFVFLPSSKAMMWWGDTLNEYMSVGYDVRFMSVKGVHNDTYQGVICPSIVRLGKKVIMEDIWNREEGVKLPGIETFAKALSYQYDADVHISRSPDGRHSDGQLAVLRPGMALSSKSREDLYEETFPGWKFVLHEPEINRLTAEQKREIDELRFVNKQIASWTGDISETHFDVNCLVRDEGHVYVSNNPPKPLGGNHTVVPWKYRWFWDGGLHCITLDIHREGKQEDYFDSKIN